MKHIISLLLILNLTSIGFSQKNDSIPKGIVYKKKSDTINEQAKKILINELKSPSFSLFYKLLYCGPNFWDYYKNDPKIGSIDKGNIDFQVPQPNGKTIVKKGKLIQSIDDFKIIWNQISKDFHSPNLTIRKLNSTELKYYWSIIFFDIEEPIFLIENNKIKLIINFFPNTMNITFVEKI